MYCIIEGSFILVFYPWYGRGKGGINERPKLLLTNYSWSVINYSWRCPWFIQPKASCHGQKWPSNLISEAILSLIKNAGSNLLHVTVFISYSSIIHSGFLLSCIREEQFSHQARTTSPFPFEQPTSSSFFHKNSPQMWSVCNPMYTRIHLYPSWKWSLPTKPGPIDSITAGVRMCPVKIISITESVMESEEN